MDGFHVTIRTSASPLSGTYSNVWISLIGTLCESPPVRVEHVLLPDSAYTVVINPKEEIGIVVLLRLRLEPQPGFPDLDWHCHDVQVRRSPEEPEVEVFPCYKWIRTADGYIELRNEKACLKKKETLDILINHREKDLQQKQQFLRWGTFVEGGPHCVDMTSVTALGPNLSYVRQRPVYNVHYIKSLTERRTSWRSLQELETFFLFNGRENKIAKYVQAHWKDDAFFGYQCLNGCNPLLIRQIHNLPPNLSVTSEMVRPFLPEDSSLGQEMERGHVFLLDYEVLDQLPANTINDKQTYLAAPLCLLHYTRQGELKPIAIQLQQAPGPQNPVFLPSDSAPDWLLAKMWVRNSDFQVHQLLTHFLRTHLFGEVCCTATFRQLPEIHPLHQLLMPHLRSTLQINIQARFTLLTTKGVFDKSIACGLEAIPMLMARATQRLRYSSMCVPEDIRARGLDALPICYYAQDALKVWEALHRFVAGWIRLYYCNDEDIQNDCELQNWIWEIFTEGFLGLSHIGAPQSFQTAAEMCKFVTMVIFSCSALHAAVNFSQLDYNIWIPNSPSAMSRPPSQTKGSVSEEDILSFLPEVNSSCNVLSILSLLSQPAIDFVPLCHYNEWYFSSGAIAKLVEEVQRELKMIAKDIADRNSQLELPYPYLSPDRIENSVTI
ncbi:polyunsaturated fatty acid lipoxygenase ALOX8 [Carassius gibelio]|uniref:polyunsaturated fatty acid lipoxygenase ALOX8 n=1 Tax=Carassius gibelio TaxID=101364 RepID=UPI002279D8A9|nr:polyunsaturated fatty acid lipoxygenase ALOX8 [Carassius gibelio]XP_052443653.1 polyunsaturated fatty acid lipoxygenase ALOX8 [Carassius gibelio]